MEVFDRIGNTFVNKTLRKYDAKDEVEIYPLAILYALDVMCGKQYFYFFVLVFFAIFFLFKFCSGSAAEFWFRLKISGQRTASCLSQSTLLNLLTHLKKSLKLKVNRSIHL